MALIGGRRSVLSVLLDSAIIGAGTGTGHLHFYWGYWLFFIIKTALTCPIVELSLQRQLNVISIRLSLITLECVV